MTVRKALGAMVNCLWCSASLVNGVGYMTFLPFYWYKHSPLWELKADVFKGLPGYV